MKTRYEEINGKRRYFVNDKEYASLDEVPKEYRSYFNDANNNGVPDEVESLMEGFKGGNDLSKVLNGLFTSVKKTDVISPDWINSSEEELFGSSGKATSERNKTHSPRWVRAFIILFILLVAALLYIKVVQ